MRRVLEPGFARPGGRTTGPALPASALFTLLWEALVDLLGPTAAATLVKRAARRAEAGCPELAGLAIQRQGLLYGYDCPSGWDELSTEVRPALRCFFDELRPLLIELTGPIVIRRLEQIHELRERRLIATEEDRK